MSIVEHVQELRRRIVVVLVALLVGTVLGYLWYSTTIGPIPSLGELLRRPYCQLPPEVRFGSENGQCRLLATSPFEMFMLRLKVGFLAGIVLSSPVWIGQIWGYITPGLKKNERRWAFGVSFIASLMFVLGAVLAYTVLHQGLYFLMTVGDEAQIAALKGEDYFNFAMLLLLVFGVSFEVPLFTVLLSFAGVLNYQQIASKRRYIIVALFAFAAVVTPADPFSMIALGTALVIMMEIAYLIIRFNDKRRERRRKTEMHDDGTITAPAPIGQADQPGRTSDVDHPSRVASSPSPRRSGSTHSPARSSGGSVSRSTPGMGRKNSFNYAEIYRPEPPNDGSSSAQ